MKSRATKMADGGDVYYPPRSARKASIAENEARSNRLDALAREMESGTRERGNIEDLANMGREVGRLQRRGLDQDNFMRDRYGGERKMKKGGAVTRGDGCATRGKTKGRMV
jgi:hypothetical protein